MRKSSIMLIFLSLFLIGAAGLAAELKMENNRVRCGESVLHFKDNGGTLVYRHGDRNLAWLTPHFTTTGRDKWYSLSNPLCAPKVLSAADQTWTLQGNIPLGSGGTMPVRKSISVTPFNTIELKVTWDMPANPKELIESGMFLSVPVAEMRDTPLLLNGRKLPVRNETKYGWFSEMVENPTIVCYAGQEHRAFSLAFAGKYFVTIGTVKDNAVTVRVITTGKVFKGTLIPE